jgi:hypothetical protein
MTQESKRLQDCQTQQADWKQWGPYLSERQWGTVREDYSPYGTAWDYFSHDQARSRAYRWGEDGIAGISDQQQLLCFAIALWNGVDPILKERLFGLTGSEGNHGEDVKEYYYYLYYYYLDSTPTHSYMKMLYKYPQAAFPYGALLEENRRRGRRDLEYELVDTDVFEGNRYFDVFVEYAKAAPEDILIQITAVNRGPETKTLHLLPTLWFRNTWAWGYDETKPNLKLIRSDTRDRTASTAIDLIETNHTSLGTFYLYCGDADQVTFTDNETNYQSLFQEENQSTYVKDGINNYIVLNQQNGVNPEKSGTKTAACYQLAIATGQSQTIKLRLCRDPHLANPLENEFDEIFQARLQEADEFYQSVANPDLSEDCRNVQRQAWAGMLWSKQYYRYSVEEWLEGDAAKPAPPPERRLIRNRLWPHFDAQEVLSMPDKWEYPWFAAWDLAFHTLPLALVDIEFAKQQLDVITREWYMHPNGQLPAYEWNFGDVNPPVHAWATWRVYQLEKQQRGKGDRQFLERVFQKLLLNFTWWVNRKDAGDNNVFEGGFLGLDNIGVFDRSAPLPTGGHLEQSDGTSWMAAYCLNLLTIALELAQENPVYEDIATKFFEHYIYIAAAMDKIGSNNDELWDEADGFFYDVLQLPDGQPIRLKVRSMVGLIPLFAVMTLESEVLQRLPNFEERLAWFIQNRPKLVKNLACMKTPGVGDRRLLSVVSPDKLRQILSRMFDPNEFLSPYGIRSMSRYHAQHPFVFWMGRQEYRVDYEPAESSTPLFGGNSNWRGPVWLPVNYLLIEALQRFHSYWGDDFKVEFPTASGHWVTLKEAAAELSQRLTRIFLRDETEKRPVYGELSLFQSDPHWKDLILFYEYFHGDNGAGIGASHQTGWTGLVATLLQER